jgi:sugar phosphate isomerase/epimerase
MIHAKELRQSDQADVPTGQGNIDFKSIIALAKKRAWPVVVEYEGENAPAAVQASAAYLKPLLG